MGGLRGDGTADGAVRGQAAERDDVSGVREREVGRADEAVLRLGGGYEGKQSGVPVFRYTADP